MTEKPGSSEKQQDATAELTLRRATPNDIPAIEAMHFLSVQGLGAADYSPAELEAFISHGTYEHAMVFGGTYYLIEDRGQVVASGGWAQHLPISAAAGAGSDEETSILSTASAKIRSVFVHPKYARRGLGSRLVRHAEEEARTAGFRLLELWASLTGVPLYRRLGYLEIRRLAIPGSNGTEVPAVHMAKLIALETNGATAAA